MLRVAGTTTSDGQRTVLVGSPNGGPIVDYGVGGGGLLARVTLRGASGRVGISGGPDDQSRPARLVVRGVDVTGIDRAMSGYFGYLTILPPPAGKTRKDGVRIDP